MYINGQGYVNNTYLQKTLYISPLMVMTEQEYTKHYFIEGERVATKIGSGFTNIPFKPFEEPPAGYQFDPNDKAEQLNEMVHRNIECAKYNGSWEINPEFEPAHFESEEYEENQYFYHPDHLGSSSFITNVIGYAEQHLQYLPYGESFIDQRFNYSSRYTFSAKEKDDETQYSYFGARYYDSDLSVWLSVDPLSDVAPSSSPYTYCSNNPIILIDPNGMKWGKPGEDEDNSDSQQAEELRESYQEKKQEYQQQFDDLQEQLVNYTGDVESDEYKELRAKQEEAQIGVGSMSQAIAELDAIAEDENYYTFAPNDKDYNTPTATKNSDGTYTICINYNQSSVGNKVHEVAHAGQIANGLMFLVDKEGTIEFRTQKDLLYMERGAYLRQYFYNKSSLPISVGSYKEILNDIGTYLNKINEKYGKEIYKL
jgi:RHS repeat-associated protein